MAVDHYSGIILPRKLRKAFTLLIPVPSMTWTFHCSTESNYRSDFCSTDAQEVHDQITGYILSAATEEKQSWQFGCNHIPRVALQSCGPENSSLVSCALGASQHLLKFH